jgi:hypothetical protein
LKLPSCESPASAFDPRRIMEYLIGKAEHAAAALKSAISKVFGIYDADEHLIHIDHTVHQSKQTFLKLHEAGHHELPTPQAVPHFPRLREVPRTRCRGPV